MKIEDAIKKSMASMIERKLNIESVVVTDWSEEIDRGWYSGCDTCGHGADDDEYKVIINYTHSGSNSRYNYYTHTGSFAELIRELDTDD